MTPKEVILEMLFPPEWEANQRSMTITRGGANAFADSLLAALERSGHRFAEPSVLNTTATKDDRIDNAYRPKPL